MADTVQDLEFANRVKELRIALGYPKRPDFAEIFGMTTSRLLAIEQGRQKMNQKDFEVIYKQWPWAIGFLLANEPLIMPSHSEKKLNKINSNQLLDDPDTKLAIKGLVKDTLRELLD